MSYTDISTSDRWEKTKYAAWLRDLADDVLWYEYKSVHSKRRNGLFGLVGNAITAAFSTPVTFGASAAAHVAAHAVAQTKFSINNTQVVCCEEELKRRGLT